MLPLLQLLLQLLLLLLLVVSLFLIVSIYKHEIGDRGNAPRSSFLTRTTTRFSGRILGDVPFIFTWNEKWICCFVSFLFRKKKEAPEKKVALEKKKNQNPTFYQHIKIKQNILYGFM